MKLNLAPLKRALDRNLKMRNFVPYERFLQAVSEQGDAWIVSQGEYVLWWQKRALSNLQVTVSNGECHATSPLAQAIIENHPNDFYASPQATIPCPDSDFDGPVWLTIDQSLEHEEIFKKALRREGILNYTEGTDGEFFFSHETAPILEQMAAALERARMGDFHRGVIEIRQLIVERLAQKRVPLLRVWYHPCVDNRIIKVVISARYDVDRAITNMPKIWDLEHKYQASSTAHLRPLGPFYSQRKIKEIVKHPTCPEIALHGEFTGHASRFGNLLKAAIAEKTKLEEITGREILGASLHGGELTKHNTPKARAVIPKAGFLYNASLWSGSTHYYFPFQRKGESGTFENTYHLHTNFRDIQVPYSEQYAEGFFNQAMRQVEITRQHHGVLVMVLHAVYFGFGSYLLNFENLVRLFAFLPTYFWRLLKHTDKN